MFRLIRNFIIILIILVALIFGFIIVKGHSMYSSALANCDLKTKIASIKESKTNYIEYNDIPKDYVNAVIATEDHRFFEHKGIDFRSLVRALVVDITKRSFEQGGSTITQQLSKNLYFDQNKDITRKIAEIFMASHLENSLTKEEIFELYANTSYFGDGYYGLGEAALGYFNKEPKDLTLYECTLLAGVPNAPSIYAPTANMDLCIQRQNQVINSMLKYNYIDENTANQIKEEQPKN